MKILVVCQFYYPENFTITKYCEQMVKDGHDVTVLTGKPNYGYGHILPEYSKVGYEVINGVKVHRVNLIARKHSRLSIINNYLSFWHNSKKWVKKTKEQFDVVYSMSLSPVTILAAGNLYKKIHHVKHVVHCVDLWPESVVVTHAIKKNSLIYRFLYRWSRSLYLKADSILIGSPSFESYFINELKIKNTPISYVPQCSLVENINGEAYNYNNKSFNILYCGNLGHIQLIPLIAETMNLLKDENVVFHVIGKGPLTGKLTSDISKYGLENNLVFHGPMAAKDTIKYHLGADALYVSLSKEGTVGSTIPNKLMMYLCCGKPIIGVLSGDGRNVLKQSQKCFYVDEDPKAIANAIKKMMSLSTQERLTIGNKNKLYYSSNFSCESITKKIEKVLLSNIDK